MSHRVPLLLLSSVLATAACIEELDTGAASGTPVDSGISDGGAASDACPNQFAVGSFGGVICGDPDGGIPVLVDGFPIELEDGGITADPCAATTQQSLEIRQKYCGSCHAPPAKLGGFDSVLDDEKLCSAVSSTVTDDAGKPVRLVIPGDPDDSRLYHRVWVGEMPPTETPALPRPTVSDVSVLRTWIQNCLWAYAGADGGPTEGGAADDADHGS